MLRASSAAITFISLLSLPSLASNVTVKQGETLSGIAERHKVPIASIITLNGLKEPNNLKAGQKLQLPNNPNRPNRTVKSIKKDHIVTHGETLSEISIKYGISQKQLISLNNLRSANHLYVGQKINLSKQDLMNNSDADSIKKATASTTKLHVVSQGQTLSSIAQDYKVSVEEIISQNNLSNPNALLVGQKIAIFSINKSEVATSQTDQFDPKSKFKHSIWRDYGPLKINWSNWKQMNGSYVTPTVHKNGDAIYLAVNCTWRKLNATEQDGTWRRWISPKDSFEYELLDDVCKAKKPQSI